MEISTCLFPPLYKPRDVQRLQKKNPKTYFSSLLPNSLSAQTQPGARPPPSRTRAVLFPANKRQLRHGHSPAPLAASHRPPEPGTVLDGDRCLVSCHTSSYVQNTSACLRAFTWTVTVTESDRNLQKKKTTGEQKMTFWLLARVSLDSTTFHPINQKQ